MAEGVARMGEFNQKVETWVQYAERLDHTLEANGITAVGKKRANLLSCIDPTTYALLTGLVAPAKLTDKSYDQLVKTLQDYFDPKPSEIVERFKFHSRVRQKGELITTFVSELRTLARNCNFGASLNDLLRDRLVCGINDNGIQRRLLSETQKLTFDRALEIAISMEAAKQHVTEIQTGTGSSNSPVINETEIYYGRLCCSRCEGNHRPDKYRFKASKCFLCGKLGHLQKVCRSASKRVGKPQSPPYTSRKTKDSKPVQQLTEYTIKGIQKVRKDKPIEVNVNIDSKPVCMELDTGAAVSIMSLETFQQLWPQRQLEPSTIRLRTYSGSSLHVKGQIQVTVKYRDQKETVSLVITSDDGPNLLGRDWLQHFRIDWAT